MWHIINAVVLSFFTTHTLATELDSPSKHNKLCPLPHINSSDTRIMLDANCEYSDTINITNSNSILDCNGAILNGQKKLKAGITINGHGKKIENVTVKNCTLLNFTHNAVVITNGVSPKKYDYDPSRLYPISPNNISLKNLNIYNSGSGAVYFYAYTHNSSLRNSKIVRSKEAGVYLSQSTKNIEISDNVIAHNGRTPKEVNRREGIAVDTSEQNIIRRNLFLGNGAGGVFLYKNCKNVSNTKTPSSSNHNIIRDNVFQGEPIGIWIASRQSRDLSTWNCKGQPLDSKGKYFSDFSDYNVVTNNRFCSGKIGVRVEGNHNKITENFFSPTLSHSVLEPFSKNNKPDGTPSKGNFVSNNQNQGCF
ncbi:right-handed parallel beta-helix repeat-containing protein [Pseudomonas sp. X10]